MKVTTERSKSFAYRLNEAEDGWDDLTPITFETYAHDYNYNE